MPTNIMQARMPVGELEQVLSTLKQHIAPDAYPQAMRTFLHYYNRIHAFHTSSTNWEYADEPQTFWLLFRDQSPALYDLVDRFLHTLANSVPCERNFSSMNILHSKTRNRLEPEVVDKLLYIQINRRVLRRERRVVNNEDTSGAWDDDGTTLLWPQSEDEVQPASPAVASVSGEPSGEPSQDLQPVEIASILNI